MSLIKKVDVCCGLNWGDEAKGKIVSSLANTGHYDMICRWTGGNNAGHTIYRNGVKYKTHLIPSGVFYNTLSIIGPDCVVNESSFHEEINYLKNNGFNTECIKISPKAHIITSLHIEQDKQRYLNNTSTAKGIAPCYRDKYDRKGIQAKDVESFEPYLWDEQLYGNILCEGAQGFWLDINQGNYPYTTSSTTLPYGACSLGFSPQLIKNIYGATKIYDTRSGYDPLFPESLRDDMDLLQIARVGNEIGTTTGKNTHVNWLNLDKLITAINITGTTHIIFSKVDIIELVNVFKVIHFDNIITFSTIIEMTDYISQQTYQHCGFIQKIIFSDNPENVSFDTQTKFAPSKKIDIVVEEY